MLLHGYKRLPLVSSSFFEKKKKKHFFTVLWRNSFLKWGKGFFFNKLHFSYFCSAKVFFCFYFFMKVTEQNARVIKSNHKVKERKTRILVVKVSRHLCTSYAWTTIYWRGGCRNLRKWRVNFQGDFRANFKWERLTLRLNGWRSNVEICHEGQLWLEGWEEECIKSDLNDIKSAK